MNDQVEYDIVTETLEDLLSSDAHIILDGGLASQLENQGEQLNSKLWSAKLLIDNPDAIYQAHRCYLESGAQIITSASYQASIPGLKEQGYSDDKTKEIILKSIEIACQCRDDFSQKNPRHHALVAASVGPYGAYLANGAEYTGAYEIDKGALCQFHQQRIEWFDHCDADMIACETIPNLSEAEALNNLLKNISKPAWVSFSCKNESQICDGTPISQAAEIFQNNPNVFAIGVNCTAPQYINALILELKQAVPEKYILVYPNAGEIYDAQSKTWRTTSTAPSFAEAATGWIKLGAKIVGGCCRIGPTEISSLSQNSTSLGSMKTA